MTLVLTEEEVERLLDMGSTLDAVENVLRDQGPRAKPQTAPAAASRCPRAA